MMKVSWISFLFALALSNGTAVAKKHAAPHDQVSACLPSFPPLVHHHGAKTVPRGTQVLASFLPITCTGYITSWTVMVKHHSHNNTIHFQIWRQGMNDTNTYYLLGSNVFSDNFEPAQRHHHVVTLPVQDKDQLMVEAGDFVGLYLSRGMKKGGFEVEAKHQRGHRVLYYTTDKALTELELPMSLSKHNKSMKWKDLVPLVDFTINETSRVVNDVDVNSTVTDEDLNEATSRPSPVVSPSMMVEDIFVAALTETSRPRDYCTNSHSTILVIFLVIAVTVLFIIVFVLGAVLIVMIRRRQKHRSHMTNENAGHLCVNMATINDRNVATESSVQKSNYYDMLSPKEHDTPDVAHSPQRSARSPVVIRTEVNACYDTVTKTTTTNDTTTATSSDDHTYTTVPMHALPKKVGTEAGKKSAEVNHYYS